MLVASKRGSFLHWLTETASAVQREQLRSFLGSFRTFLLERERSPSKARFGRLLSQLTTTDEDQDAVAEATRKASIALYARIPGVRVSPWESLRTLHRERQLMAKIKACATKDEDGHKNNFFFKAQLLLEEIGKTVNCEVVMLVPVPGTESRLLADCVATRGVSPACLAANKERNASKAHPDWSLDRSTPGGLCVESGKVVVVDNLLFDDRFDFKYHRSLKFNSTSSICVPIYAGYGQQEDIGELHPNCYDRLDSLRQRFEKESLELQAKTSAITRQLKAAGRSIVGDAKAVVKKSSEPLDRHLGEASSFVPHPQVVAVLKCINKRVRGAPAQSRVAATCMRHAHECSLWSQHMLPKRVNSQAPHSCWHSCTTRGMPPTPWPPHLLPQPQLNGTLRTGYAFTHDDIFLAKYNANKFRNAWERLKEEMGASAALQQFHSESAKKAASESRYRRASLDPAGVAAIMPSDVENPPVIQTPQATWLVNEEARVAQGETIKVHAEYCRDSGTT